MSGSGIPLKPQLLSDAMNTLFGQDQQTTGAASGPSATPIAPMGTVPAESVKPLGVSAMPDATRDRRRRKAGGRASTVLTTALDDKLGA